MGLDKEQNELIAHLYQEMYRQLYLYALSALDDRNLAEEAVQDTFRLACSKIDSLVASANQKGWLTNTLKNVIRNIRRSRARLGAMVVDALSVDENMIVTQEEQVNFDLYYSDLLEPDEFSLLKSIVLNHDTMLEAAQERNISVEACKKRVQRAKKKLKNILEKLE